jgi:hypothetical protein
MRFAVLVCLLAVGLVASSNVPKPFKAGQTYNYRFRTQVSSALLSETPSAIQQQAATGMQALVKLTFTNDRHARVQLKDLRIGEMNGRVEMGQQQLIPTDMFEKRQIPEELKQKLELPFTVSLVDGVVERLNFNQDESVWSKNIKRAAVNMLQLNLKRNDVQGLKMESSQPQNEKEQRQLSVFTIPEITLEGECETIYTIQKRQSRSQSNNMEQSQEQQDDESAQQVQFNVTKNINFNKCQRTSDVSYGFQPNPTQQLRCLKCLRQTSDIQKQAVGKTEKQEQLKIAQCQEQCQTNQLNHNQDIERSTVAHFELQGNTQKYGIRRSKIISQYVIKGQNPAAQNTISQVVAISELVYTDNQDESKVPDVQESSEETLLYSPEWDLQERRFYMWGDEEFEHKRSPFAKVQRKAEQASEYTQQILKQWAEDKEMGYELDTALLFNKLVQLIRQSSAVELKQIEEKIMGVANEGKGERKSVEHAKALFQDALAVGATRNSIHVLQQKIQQKEISSIKAAQLIKVFVANQHSPSDRQADLLEKIANSELAQQCPVLRQTAWLSYGSAIGKICQQQPGQSQQDQFRVEEVCPETKKDQYKKTLILQWKQADRIYDQILALKVIGNSALEKVLPELQKIIADKRQPTLIRMEAIDALRRLRTSVPGKIQQTLLPIFQDQREQPEVRMAAVSMILYTHPAQAILDQIVFSVQNDRSQNVKSFVLTALDSLSRSPAAAEQQIAKHLKAALKIVKVTPEQMRASRKYRVPIYVSEQENTEEQNVFLGLASIVSPSNLIPVHLAASIRSAFNGDATQEKLQVSFSQKDLEQLYEKLSNVYERFGRNDQEKSGEERQSAKDLRQIYSSLGIKSRRTGSYYASSEGSEESSETTKRSTKLGSNKPFGMIVIRTNDVDQVIVPIDEQKFPEMIRKFINGEKQSLGLSSYSELIEQLSAGKHFNQHLAMSIGETKTKLPTTSGLPLAVIWQTSAVASVEGKINAQLEAGERKLKGELEIRTSGIATHMHKTEVWSPVVVTGVKSIRTIELNHAPMKLQVKIGGGDVKFSVLLPKQQQKERVLGLHTLPATYTQRFQWETRTYAKSRIQTVRNFALEYSQQEFHQQEQSQRAIRVEGQVHRVQSLKQLVNALYTTENNVHIFFKPTEQTPEEISLRISGSAFRKADQGEHKGPEFNDFYQQSSQRKPFRSLYEDEEEYKSMEFQNNKHREERLSGFTSKYQSDKAYKHQLKIELEARAPVKTHRAEVQVQATCDQRLEHCKAILNAQRTPIWGEQKNWEIQAKLQTVAPENVRNGEEPDQKHSRALIKAEAEWGPQGTDQNRVDIRLQGEPTRKTYWRSDSADKWARFLNKFDLVAEYKLHSQQRHFVQRAFELLKARYFWQLSTDQERKGENNVVHATLVIDPITRRHANLTIQTPTERVQGKMIELPVRLQSFQLEKRPAQYHSFGQLLSSYTQQGSAECRADDRRVRTFDGVSYKAPMSECWSVLAKDCSREDPRFVVLMKKSEEETKVKIITQKAVIELQKQSDKQQMIVKIDGQKVEDEEKLQENGIEKSESQVYVQQKGIQVRFDGEEASIKVSGLYKNIQCGLCGHYSGEEEDIFRTSDNKRSQNLKEFHKSYTLKNQECEEKKLNKFYQDQDSEEFQVKQRKPQSAYYRNSYNQQERDESSEEDNQWWDSEENKKESQKEKSKPVDRTHVLEYSQKICFSSEPVKKCPQGMTQDENSESKQTKVQFFCLNRSSTQARRLQRQVRQGIVVESKDYPLSFFDTIEQPTKCQQAEFY